MGLFRHRALLSGRGLAYRKVSGNISADRCGFGPGSLLSHDFARIIEPIQTSDLAFFFSFSFFPLPEVSPFPPEELADFSAAAAFL